MFTKAKLANYETSMFSLISFTLHSFPFCIRLHSGIWVKRSVCPGIPTFLLIAKLQPTSAEDSLPAYMLNIVCLCILFSNKFQSCNQIPINVIRSVFNGSYFPRVRQSSAQVLGRDPRASLNFNNPSSWSQQISSISWNHCNYSPSWRQMLPTRKFLRIIDWTYYNGSPSHILNLDYITWL